MKQNEDRLQLKCDQIIPSKFLIPNALDLSNIRGIKKHKHKLPLFLHINLNFTKQCPITYWIWDYILNKFERIFFWRKRLCFAQQDKHCLCQSPKPYLGALRRPKKGAVTSNYVSIKWFMSMACSKHFMKFSLLTYIENITNIKVKMSQNRQREICCQEHFFWRRVWPGAVEMSQLQIIVSAGQ